MQSYTRAKEALLPSRAENHATCSYFLLTRCYCTLHTLFSRLCCRRPRGARTVPNRLALRPLICLNPWVGRRTTEQATPAGYRIGPMRVSHLNGNQKSLATQTAHDALLLVLFLISCIQAVNPRWRLQLCHSASCIFFLEPHMSVSCLRTRLCSIALGPISQSPRSPFCHGR